MQIEIWDTQSTETHKFIHSADFENHSKNLSENGISFEYKIFYSIARVWIRSAKTIGKTVPIKG